MPQMGVSVVEGTVVAWLKAPGDPVRADEAIAEVSTDKIDIEVPAPVDGTLAEICVAVETTVPVGTVLARIAGDGAVPEPDRFLATDQRPQQARRRLSPVVQRIAAEHGIDLDAVTGTGRDGRVRKQDVLALVHGDPPLHIESPYRPDPEPPPAPEGGTLSRMRRTIGEHMKRSLDTAATCTTWIEVDMSRIEHARREHGTTALAHVARCAVGALREFPALNAWLEDDRHTVHDGVHLGIAVSLDEEGLIVPVVRDAHELSAEGLATRIGDLARRARARELTPDEVRGGTFTITNPGQYGALMATPVIHQPQVAILDVEAIVKRPVVVTDDHGHDAIAIRPLCVLGLSWDHRALDGALAARFLAAVRRRAEAYEA
jgi:2-oxoglutarate dehydrogenase E2 component (dihydrolipoamide succinyltransferase)